MNLTMAQIKAALIAATQAIAYYDEKPIKDMKNIAAYHLQQAAEKLIKIQIYAGSTVLNYANLYTHNLEKLTLYADSLGLQLDLPDYIGKNSLVLTSWEAGSRYDVGFQIRIDTLRRAYGEILMWYDRLYASGLRNA